MSSDGFLSLSSPSNTYVWNIRNFYSSWDKSASRVEHVLTEPVVTFESQDPIASSGAVQRRSVIESCAWSPLGLSDSGACLLARAVHSDGSLHVKLYKPVVQMLEVSLVERVCLISLLRDQWLQIPLFSKSGERSQLTSVYPSASYLLDHPDRCSLAWLSQSVWSQGILATAWNDIVFVWSVSANLAPRAICSLQSGSSDSISRIEFSSAIYSLGSPDIVEIFLKVFYSFGEVHDWTLVLNECFDASTMYLHTAVGEAGKPHEANRRLVKCLNHKNYFSDSVKGGAALAACSSPNEAIDFIVKRTSRSVEILWKFSNETANTMQMALESLISAALHRPRTPLLDIAKAISTLHATTNNFPLVKTQPIDATCSTSIFNAMLQRFLPGTAMDLSDLNLGIRIAFGLFHILNSKKISEKKFLLSLLRVPLDNPKIFCGHCESTQCVLADDLRSSQCSNGHTSLICQVTMSPITASTPAVQCCFCRSIMLAAQISPEALNICKLCRIGLTFTI